MKVKVLKSFCIGGKAQKVGDVLDLTPAIANNLVFRERAEQVDETASKKTSEAPAKGAEAPKAEAPGKPAKGGKK